MLETLIKFSPLSYLTQSLWRDEAFSILTSELPLAAIISKLTLEPPLYYTLLHFWIRLFGNSEIAARSLSFLGFALATIVVIFWAEKIFKKHWLSWYTPIFFFLNPMLLYYAFEVRTYGWYMFFATAALFAYDQRKWKWYIAAIVLGFYTHAYMIVLPVVVLTHYAITHLTQIKKIRSIHAIWKDQMLRSSIIIGALVAPWLIRIGIGASKLRESWFYPIDLELIQSVLGNMFLGYDGTPWYGWQYTRIISLILLVFFFLALRNKKTRNRNLLFFYVIFIPLEIVIGISFFKPLFVNRYLIPVTIAQVLLLACSFEAIKNQRLQKITAAVMLFFVVGFNIWYPSQHPKVPIRNTIQQVNMLLGEHDVIYAGSSLVYFETVYYAKDRSKVFFFNPHHSEFPWYVGDVIFSEDRMAYELPEYPHRAFIIHRDGTFELAFQTMQEQPGLQPALTDQ